MRSMRAAASRRRPRPHPRLRSAAVVCGALALACHDVHFDPHTRAGEITIYDDLYAISTPDEDHVVTAGYWGTIYVSEDGGGTWVRGETGTSRLLYGVSMADAQRGWAIGQLGTILRTEDGGRTWRPQPNIKEEQGYHLFGVQALDSERAWVVGEWGTRLFTVDGGASWDDRSLTIDEFHPQFVWLSTFEQDKVRRGEKVFEDVGLNDVYCLPPPSESCWIAGEFGYIFYSHDRGVTWARAVIEGDVGIDPIELGYNEIELRPGDDEQLRQFADRILEHQHLNVGIAPVASAREIREFGRAEDPTELFDILEARTEAIKAVLEDAGLLSDRIRKRGSPPWDYEDFLDDDPDFLNRYLEGRKAVRPGARVEVAQNPYLFTIRFHDDKNGYIAGLGGVILRSSDGGRTWSYRQTDRKQAIFSLSPSGGRLTAVGEKGFVRVSTDGGDTWRGPDSGFPPIFTFMRDVNFGPERRVGFIVGQRGLVLRTRDGGATWAQVLPPVERRLGADATG